MEKTFFQRDSGGPQIRLARGGKRVKAHKNKEDGSLAPQPSSAFPSSVSLCTSSVC